MVSVWAAAGQGRDWVVFGQFGLVPAEIERVVLVTEPSSLSSLPRSCLQ